MAQSGPSDSNEQPEAATEGSLALSLKLGAAGIVFFAAIFGAVAIFAGGSDPDTRVSAYTLPPTVLGVSTQPARDTDTPTSRPTDTRTPVTSSISTTPAIIPATGNPVFPTNTQPPTPTALSTATGPSLSTPTPGTASPTPPIATPTPGSAVADLVAQIQNDFGVRVLTDGQDWGTDEQRQLRNLGAVRTALTSMPNNVIAAIVAGDGGALTFLSNNAGRTEAGWQPYGDRAANYYSNEDRGQGGTFAANQIVLQTGSTAQTIAHEMSHAYQMRDMGPGQYVEALLTPEMKSFMAATGWTQLISDEELRANANQSWSQINAFFEYDGRDLSYINEFGTGVTLYAPNPIEGYAEAAGLYYAHSDGTTLPQWPEYWDWFSANVG